MKTNQFLFLSLISLCFLAPSQSEARKRKRSFKRKWAVSLTNGFNLYRIKKGSAKSAMKWGDPEGQMHFAFSSFDISRNFGYYEIGAKIQNIGPTFVSPFIKWNLNKNSSRASIVPAISLGVVPSHILGTWLRLSLGLSINPYFSIAPFVGTYAWFKIKDDPEYEKYNLHFNAGLRISLYY